jgi:ABC-type multidrug transport system permease subunit
MMSDTRGALNYGEWLRSQNQHYFQSNSGSAIIPQPSSDFVYNSFDIVNKMMESKSISVEQMEEYQKINLSNFEWLSNEYKDYTNRRKSFGKAIFIVVMFLIISGVAFAACQLYYAILFGNNESLKTTFEFGKSGLYFASSLVGGFVLFISLGFFYLFLKHVYNIDPPPSIPVMNPTKPEDLK